MTVTINQTRRPPNLELPSSSNQATSPMPPTATGSVHEWLSREPRSSSPKFVPGMPDPPIDARWQIALRTVRRGDPLPAAANPWTAACITYLEELLACQGDADLQRLTRDMPDLHAAVQLYASRDKLACGELEGRLLSRQPFPDIAAACGLTLQAVEAYHALFFDVRDKLDANAYICIHALGKKHLHGLTEEDQDVFLRWIGYVRGPVAVDYFLEYYRKGLTIPPTLEGLSRQQLERLYDLLSVRALILARVVPFKKLVQVHLLRYLLKELSVLIENWPADGMPASSGTGPILVDPREWADWRKAVGAASTGRGLRKLLERAGAA